MTRSDCLDVTVLKKVVIFNDDSTRLYVYVTSYT